MTKKIVLALVLGFSGLAVAAEGKIGLVDMQRAIQETSAGKKAKAELESDFNKKKKELEKKEAEIKKLGEDLEKKALVLSDDVKAKKQQEVQGEMRKYQEAVQKSQMEIQKHERDLTQPIITKIRSIIEDISKKENYALVLEKSEQLVLFSVKEIDLTDRVIKEFDSKK
jgi:outer membrane protein